MSFVVTELPEDEKHNKSVSETDINIKRKVIEGEKEFENRPWFKVIDIYSIEFYFIFIFFYELMFRCKHI